MSLFKEVLFSKRKKSKSMHLTNEMLARKLGGSNTDNNLNRNSFSGVITTNNIENTEQKGMNSQRKLSRSSSHADNEAILLNAVAHEDVGTVKRIIESGKVDLNVMRNGLTPLHHACVNGNINIVRLMVVSGNVDVNLKCKDGTTPLKLAVLNGHYEVASLLISSGSNDTDIINGV